MFAQFRSQYPQGSIQTEMLPKQEGKFICRATVSVNQVILSTATAWDNDLERAEEKAIERALTFAGISQLETVPALPQSHSPLGEFSLTPPTNHHPEDLSDAITQTQVEMERLGWTTKQGQEYLMRTFGKKSRHQLTPSELRQFLAYLQSQPSR
ncbi:MAG: hypothetical protein ACK421_00170 [Pseudanabaenaceae cyanobacterium]